MSASKNVSDLFRPRPIQWGLRGDPFLWDAMASLFVATPLPSTESELIDMLSSTFGELVGDPLESSIESVFVERFAHGGMSSGRIWLPFWREKGIPLLISRYGELLTTAAG